MKKNDIDFDLKVWGAWVERHITWADDFGENILYRAAFGSGRNTNPGHKILAPECPPFISRIDRAVRRLNDSEQEAIVTWYVCPVDYETGKLYTKQQRASDLGISYEAFHKRLYRGRRNVKKCLDTVYIYS